MLLLLLVVLLSRLACLEIICANGSDDDDDDDEREVAAIEGAVLFKAGVITGVVVVVVGAVILLSIVVRESISPPNVSPGILGVVEVLRAVVPTAERVVVVVAFGLVDDPAPPPLQPTTLYPPCWILKRSFTDNEFHSKSEVEDLVVVVAAAEGGYTLLEPESGEGCHRTDDDDVGVVVAELVIVSVQVPLLFGQSSDNNSSRNIRRSFHCWFLVCALKSPSVPSPSSNISRKVKFNPLMEQ